MRVNDDGIGTTTNVADVVVSGISSCTDTYSTAVSDLVGSTVVDCYALTIRWGLTTSTSIACATQNCTLIVDTVLT